MIKTPSVIILGAGASHEYGFPLGTELMEKMKRLCSDVLSRSTISDYANLALEVGHNKNEIKRLKEALDFVSVESIDELIHRNKELTEVSKTIISIILLSHEKQNNLSQQLWYKKFFRLLADDASNIIEAMNNEVVFITFNYDRSLDHALYLELKHLYGYESNDSMVQAAMNTIPIIHVYGQLGHLPSRTDKESVPFEATLNANIITNARKEITFFHNSSDREKIDLAISKKIKNAERLFIFGFGFHRINLARLSIDQLNENTKIYATCYMLNGKRRAEALKFISDTRSMKGHEPNFLLENLTIDQYLSLNEMLIVS